METKNIQAFIHEDDEQEEKGMQIREKKIQTFERCNRTRMTKKKKNRVLGLQIKEKLIFHTFQYEEEEEEGGKKSYLF